MMHVVRYILVAFILCFFSVMSAYAAGDAAYRISNVNISSSGSDASVVRKRAIEKGNQYAFEKLMGRLVGAYPSELRTLEAKDIEDLVASYDIQSEKMTAKHYRAVMHVAFTPYKVRRLLQRNNIAFSEPSVTQVVIIPVTYDVNHEKITDEKPWFNAWQRAAAGQDGLHFDVSPASADIVTDRVMRELWFSKKERAAESLLKRLQRQFGTEQVMVAVASYHQSQQPSRYRLKLQLHHSFADPMVVFEEMSFEGKPGHRLDRLLHQAVEKVIATHGNSVKQQEVAVSEAAQEVPCAMVAENPGHWRRMQKRLEALPYVRDIKVKKLSPALVTFAVVTSKTSEELAVAFSEEGLGVEEETDQLLLFEY